MAKKQKYFPWLPLIFLVALVLNLYGIAFDLPQVTHPDEPRIIRHAMAMGSGDLNPHFFISPTFWTYVVFLTQALAALVGLFLGWVHSPSELLVWAFSDQTFYFIFPRLLTAILGASTAVWVFKIGQKFSNQIGWVAAAIFSLWSPWVWQAHYATTDVPLVFLSMAAIWATLQSLESPRHAKRWLWAAAALAGLAFSTKFNALPVLGAVGVATWLQIQGKKNKNLSLAAQILAVFFAAFAITSPYYFLAFREAWHGLKFVGTDIVVSKLPVSVAAYVVWLGQHTATALFWMIAAAWALVQNYRKSPYRQKLWVLAGFVLPYLFLIQATHYKAIRYLLPVWPFVAVLAAIGWVYLKERYFKKNTWLIYVLLIVSLVPMVYQTYQMELAFRKNSVARQTTLWIKAHVSNTQSLWVDHKTQIQLLPNRLVVQSRRKVWQSAPHNPVFNQLNRVYGYYLQSNLAEQGYLLQPSQQYGLNSFNSGYVLSDFELRYVKSVQYVVLNGDRLESANPLKVKKFVRYVQRHFHEVQRFSDGQRQIVIFERD